MMFMNGGGGFDEMFDFDFEGEAVTEEDEATDETESDDEE